MEAHGHQLPETPPEVLGPTIHETIALVDRRFILGRPDAVDRLRDHPILGGGSAADEYVPYWAHLWPAARLLADAILREPWSATGQPSSALELGCGLGLPGLAALSRGVRVTFSDYDATALRYAADNARANGFTDFDVLLLDWRRPPHGRRFPLLLGADLLYDVALVAPLAALVRQMLEPGGVALLANGDRVAVQALGPALGSQGLAFTREERALVVEGVEYRGSLYRIGQAASRGA
jgi:hypothetical protein